MSRSRRFLGALALTLSAAQGFAASNSAATSVWARPGAGGKLAYQTLPTGDRIMDFSSAGYMGGGVKLPRMPVEKLVKPSGGDDTQVGLSRVRIVAPPQPVAIVDTVNSIRVAHAARRVTLDEVSIRHTVATKGAAKPADFSIDGAQVLFDRCTATGDSVFFLATGAGVSGPNVLLQCTFRGHGWIQPFQRWATGLLIDNCRVPEGGIDSLGVPVAPTSLYLAQLAERLGAQAVKNLEQ